MSNKCSCRYKHWRSTLRRYNNKLCLFNHRLTFQWPENLVQWWVILSGGWREANEKMKKIKQNKTKQNLQRRKDGKGICMQSQRSAKLQLVKNWWANHWLVVEQCRIPTHNQACQPSLRTFHQKPKPLHKLHDMVRCQTQQQQHQEQQQQQQQCTTSEI